MNTVTDTFCLLLDDVYAHTQPLASFIGHFSGFHTKCVGLVMSLLMMQVTLPSSLLLEVLTGWKFLKVHVAVLSDIILIVN